MKARWKIKKGKKNVIERKLNEAERVCVVSVVVTLTPCPLYPSSRPHNVAL